MANWFRSLSIRWKLQFGFFAVTMVTTVYNRLLASYELGQMVDIARQGGVNAQVIAQLEANHHAYIFNSFWESGLEFLLQFLIIGMLAAIFVKPIQTLCLALKAVQDGDLTKELKVSSRDEIGMVEESFNQVLKMLNRIMRDVNSSGKKMEQSTFQIAQTSHEIAEVGRKEQSRSAEVSHATEQLHHISESVQAQAQGTTERARKTAERAHEGIRMVQKNISEMQETTQQVNRAVLSISELEQSAGKIHDIITTIQTIARQTNLLALNAAIEAARAGEQGRGFAVVADEVRKLAERTTFSAGEVSEIISALGGKVQQVTASMSIVVGKVQENQKVASETAAVIEHMADDVAQSVHANNEISDASGKQISNVRLLEDTLAQLFSTLHESSAKVETTAAIGESLHKVTGTLNQLMAGFTFVNVNTVEAAQHEKRTVPRLSNLLLVHATQGDRKVDCSGLDFSLTGICLMLNQQLDSSAPVELTIQLPQDDFEKYRRQVPLQITGRITWQRPENHKFLCGIAFSNLSGSDSNRLRECFKYFNRMPEFDVAPQPA
ncbi:MAG: methyl-accepting chemotaxis protein [Pseudomonadota bacterium]